MLARHMSTALLASLKDTPAVFLQGPRQSSKSTLCQMLAAKGIDARYLTLDDATVLAAARSDPAQLPTAGRRA